MKRKEQNRAAQRAFRERKEKHVKDVSVAYKCFFFTPHLSASSRTRLPTSKLRMKGHCMRTRTFVICSHASRQRTSPLSRAPSLSPFPNQELLRDQTLRTPPHRLSRYSRQYLRLSRRHRPQHPYRRKPQTLSIGAP